MTCSQQAIENAQKEYSIARNKLFDALKAIPEKEVSNYDFMTVNGPVKLSSLFGAHDELLVIHNMGIQCPYCTLWADGFNGVIDHLADRCAVVMFSNDKPEIQKEFADSRGWKFRLVSGHRSSFSNDLGMTHPDWGAKPGIISFRRGYNGSIKRVSMDMFGPGDVYSAVWHMFELLPNGVDGWQPKFKY